MPSHFLRSLQAALPDEEQRQQQPALRTAPPSLASGFGQIAGELGSDIATGGANLMESVAPTLRPEDYGATPAAAPRAPALPEQAFRPATDTEIRRNKLEDLLRQMQGR